MAMRWPGVSASAGAGAHCQLDFALQRRTTRWVVGSARPWAESRVSAGKG